MEVAARVRRARERDVDLVLGDRPVELRALERRLPRGDGLLDGLAGGIQRHARLAVADLAQRELQRALPSQVRDARVVELGERAGGRDRVESLALQRLRIHGGDCIYMT